MQSITYSILYEYSAGALQLLHPYIHTAPCDRKESRYHWHLEITPRLTETAGFERGTGFYINPVMPEDAAQILREGAKTPS